MYIEQSVNYLRHGDHPETPEQTVLTHIPDICQLLRRHKRNIFRLCCLLVPPKRQLVAPSGEPGTLISDCLWRSYKIVRFAMICHHCGERYTLYLKQQTSPLSDLPVFLFCILLFSLRSITEFLRFSFYFSPVTVSVCYLLFSAVQELPEIVH